jgi:hypothetical protein
MQAMTRRELLKKAVSGDDALAAAPWLRAWSGAEKGPAVGAQ